MWPQIDTTSGERLRSRARSVERAGDPGAFLCRESRAAAADKAGEVLGGNSPVALPVATTDAREVLCENRDCLHPLHSELWRKFLFDAHGMRARLAHGARSVPTGNDQSIAAPIHPAFPRFDFDREDARRSDHDLIDVAATAFPAPWSEEEVALRLERFEDARDLHFADVPVCHGICAAEEPHLDVQAHPHEAHDRRSEPRCARAASF